MLIVIGCKDGKKEDKGFVEQPSETLTDKDGAKMSTQKNEVHNTREKSNESTDLQKLKQAFVAKEELLFLDLFPSEFHQFLNYFGWNNKGNQPSELYQESYIYIDYFFKLLRKHKGFESKLIGIAKNGHWQADGVSYFQEITLKYIKNKNQYNLINELTSGDAKSVLFFLFDGPRPKFDTNFASRLSPANKEILEELFETGFYDLNENPDAFPDEEITTYNLSDYLENEHFFTKNIDINNDGIKDIIVSAEPYQGDELILFVNTEKDYQFVLKTTNFSQDGGNQIADIMQEEGGFVIKTVFLDGGFYEIYHHIIFDNDRWLLSNTVYKTESSNQEDAFIYVCDVVQGLDLADTYLLDNVKWIPNEEERERLCTIEIF